MILSARILALAVATGTAIKNLITNQGTLSTLTTTAKNSLVAAINEVKSSSILINDTTASGTTTYSSNKIQLVADASALATKNALLAGASSAFDTLKEIEVELIKDSNIAAGLTTAVGNRVRFDAAQSLTTAQITQVGNNIGIGEPDTDFVAAFKAALV